MSDHLFDDVIPPEDMDKAMACIDLLGRTGAVGVQLRYDDAQQPALWMAVAEFRRRDGSQLFEVGAHLGPLKALTRLLDELIDGGTCQHCGRSTGFDATMNSLPEAVVMEGTSIDVCWYQWDPELKTFRRGCE